MLCSALLTGYGEGEGHGWRRHGDAWGRSGGANAGGGAIRAPVLGLGLGPSPRSAGPSGSSPTPTLMPRGRRPRCSGMP